jgi:hypothetical protein
MTRILIASLVLGALVAACPGRLRGWVERWLRRFPSLAKRCLRFIDRLLLDVDVHYPVLAR